MTMFVHPVSGQVQTAHSPAVESFLRTRGYELHATPEDAADLKGAALDEALEVAGLVKSGSAGEKRARLVEHVGDTPERILSPQQAAAFERAADTQDDDWPDQDDGPNVDPTDPSQDQ